MNLEWELENSMFTSDKEMIEFLENADPSELEDDLNSFMSNCDEDEILTNKINGTPRRRRNTIRK